LFLHISLVQSQPCGGGADQICNGTQATSLGFRTIATGDFSTATGYQTRAIGWSSTATGANTIATGYVATTIGATTVASHTYSVAMGDGSHASGYVSTTTGQLTKASGSFTMTMGQNTEARAGWSVALGRFNVPSGSSETWVSSDPIFVIGNGANDFQKNNAFVVYKNGKVNNPKTTHHADKLLKENIEPISSLLMQKLKNIKPVYFNWKEKKFYGNDREIGILAQDVEIDFPELVSNASGHLSLDYSRLSVLLLQGMKEMDVSAQIESNKIKNLENKNKLLKDSISKMNKKVELLEEKINKIINYIKA